MFLRKELIVVYLVTQNSQATNWNLKDYREIIDKINVGYFRVDNNGIVLMHNPKFNEILGKDPSIDLVGTDAADLWQRFEDRKYFLNALQEKGEVKNFITPLIKMDGNEVIIQIDANLIKDENGLIIGREGILLDITEKTELERKLKESEAFYRNIIYNLDLGFFRVSLKDQIILSHNPRLNEIFGIKPKADLTGQKIYNIWKNPNDQKTIRNRIFQEGVIKDYVVSLKDIKGNKITVQINAHFVKDAHDKPFAIEGTFSDITEKQKLENKLKESEEMYRLITENANDLIHILNDQFVIEYINEEAYKRFLGYTKDDLVGISAKQIIHPDEYKSVVKHVKDVLRNGEGMREGRIKHKDGHWVWFDIKSKLFYDQAGNKKILPISRDITDRKIAEQELKESEKKYRQAFNQASLYKDIFAHDINNILQNINSSTELISLYLNNPEKLNTIKELNAIVKEQIHRGVKLIANVQKLSQIEESDLILVPKDINITLLEAMQFVHQSFKTRDINFQIEGLDRVFMVPADELLLDVFENLMINSVRHNTNLTVEIIIRISKTVEDNTNFVKIEFIDNAVGINDRRKDAIFERGLKQNYGLTGLGLGLSLVKKIVNRYNGKIWVENRVEDDYTKGSNFVLMIPEIN